MMLLPSSGSWGNHCCHKIWIKFNKILSSDAVDELKYVVDEYIIFNCSGYKIS